MTARRAAAMLSSIPTVEREHVNLYWILHPAMHCGEDREAYRTSVAVRFLCLDLLGNVGSFAELRDGAQIDVPLDQIRRFETELLRFVENSQPGLLANMREKKAVNDDIKAEMKQALATGGIQLTRSLGQNFLHDGNQLRRIVAAAELSPSDKVLEIGPGLGPLTELLLAQAGEVLAIELDRRLVEFLQTRLAATPHLRLVHDDALALLRREPRDWRDWKLVANLPYSVASPLLVELAQAPARPRRMVATLQLEVARRLMARADDDDYGLLTLLVQLHYEPRDFFKIPPGCFFPEPDVDSACVVLLRRATPLLNDAGAVAFTRLVKRAFSQRRKMMLKLLKQDWPADTLAEAFAQTGLSPQVRAEAVSLEQFVALTRRLHE